MNDQEVVAAPQDYSYIIQTGKDGWLDGTVTARKHVVDLLERAVTSGKPVVIHLHGGLVAAHSAYDMVNRLQPQYLSEGFFPIFIVWRTGLLDAFKNAAELVERPLFQRLLVRLLKHFVGRYGDPITGKALGAGEEPDDAEVEAELQKREMGEIPYEDVHPEPDDEEMSEAEKDDLERAIQADDELKAEWRTEVNAPPRVVAGKSIGIDEDVRVEARLQDQQSGEKALLSGAVLAKHAIKIAARIVKRYYRHRDHGLHTTIVEEILREIYFDLVGTEVWQFMKQDAADTFKPGEPERDRGGALLMRLLGDVMKQRQEKGDALPAISIVGHSAGSIYASNLLTHLATERVTPSSPWYGIPFQFERLVFLAPAITCKALAPLLDRHAREPLFKSFRMYSLSEQAERGYFEVPVLYPGSLLYMISGLLESVDDDGSHDMPLVGMQRYARSKNPFSEPEVTQVWAFLNKAPTRLVWSGDNHGPGLACDSVKHGDFFRTPKTIASFLFFLK